MEKLITILIVNIILSSVFYYIHKRFDYTGTRWFLVALTMVLPFLGALYFIILTIKRMFRKNA